MKKLALLLVAAFIVTLGLVSCSKSTSGGNGGTTPSTPSTYSELIVGRWKTADGGHFEVYNSNGTGHMWDPADDVQEDEADNFDYTINEEEKHMTQIIHFQGGQGDVPQSCNILILNDTTFKYNNEALKAEYTLTRVN